MANPTFTFWNFLEFIFKYFWSMVDWICGYRTHWYGNLTILGEKYTKHREMLKKKKKMGGCDRIGKDRSNKRSKRKSEMAVLTSKKTEFEIKNLKEARNNFSKKYS